MRSIISYMYRPIADRFKCTKKIIIDSTYLKEPILYYSNTSEVIINNNIYGYNRQIGFLLNFGISKKAKKKRSSTFQFFRLNTDLRNYRLNFLKDNKLQM